MPQPFAEASDEVRVSVQGWTRAAGVTARRAEAMFAQLVTVADAVVIVVSLCAAYWLRNQLSDYGQLLPIAEYTWLLGLVIPIWLALARSNGLTASSTYRQPAHAVALTLKIQLAGALVLLSALYLMKAVDVSRLLMQTFVVISGAALVVERLAIHAAVIRFGQRWRGEARRLLVVGSVDVAEGLHGLLGQRPHWGTAVVGVITNGNGAARTVPVLGRIEDLPTLLDTMVFDEIVMADAATAEDHGDRIVSTCLERGLTYHTLVRMPGRDTGRHHAEVLGDGLYLVSLERTPQNVVSLSMKRAIDVAGACAGLIICGIAFLVLAPLIRWDSSGPIIFRQIRVGRNGRRFTLYKFRTMYAEAELDKARLQADNEMNGHIFKVRDDPRITPLGRFLRQAYLDELPQFWNVLRGEMSLVGTRPPTPEEVACYSPNHRRRLSMRPGITGLWQSQGETRAWDFEQIVTLDCEYIDRWSLALDARILCRTCVTVMQRAGH